MEFTKYTELRLKQQGDDMNKKATFAAGCFWGVESAFREINGVQDAIVGYTGGVVDGPDYRTVCTGRTGHAEAVEVTYDPDMIRYEDLLDAFWKMHNPTQGNRQGVDVGTQYRSAIFYHDEEQKKLAEASKAALEASHRYSRPITTQIVPAMKFWKAEEYHQRYNEKHGLRSCHI
ncbi:MAG TPA: peptide-methionine (S)-S-oxide reductase MsrA [Methanomassiliicoccales archaeon]|nr:peptide-methionine (S)-S-oxide reductase MsrA [Methanomassiliicoccales archaeon]